MAGRARFTASHWGIYEIEESAETGPRLKPYQGDPDPSEIGLHLVQASRGSTRVVRPAIRESWLKNGPGSRTDKRGDEAFVEVEWAEALDLVARELERVRRAHGNSAIFGGSYGWSSAGRFHHAQSQIHRFLNTIGGYVRHKDSYSIAAAQVVMGHIIAPMTELEYIHTSWNVLRDHTELFVTFGGIPVKNAQVTAGGAGRHRVVGGVREMAAAGVRFVNISPVSDNLSIADPQPDWIQIRPNTDTALMLALCYVLQEERLADLQFLQKYCVGYPVVLRYLDGRADGIAKTPEWAEAISGVPASRIRALARDMAQHRTMVNAAWSLQRASCGEQPYWAIVTLAAMLGQIGLPGGGFGVGYGMTNGIGSSESPLKGPTLSQLTNAVADFIPVARIADMLLKPGDTFTYNGGTYRYPDARLVYWAGGNPFHHHQDLNRLRLAWSKPETIIVHEQVWTATARRADIVLPVTTTLERDDISFANREGHLVAMHQALPRHREARDDYWIFSELARRMGTESTFTEGRSVREWLRALYERTRSDWESRGIAVPGFEAFWDQGVLAFDQADREVVMFVEFRADPVSSPLRTPSGRIELFSERVAGFGIADCPGHAVWIAPPEWLGAPLASRYPLHLLSDQPARKLHSQLDMSDWSSDGKISAREPIYMNRADAARRGIADGAVVEVFNDRGRCLAGLKITDEIMPGVVRMSTGAWYDPEAGSDLEKHGNPNVLTADFGCSGLSQGCSAQTCLVEVRGPVEDAPRVTAFDPPSLTSRNEASAEEHVVSPRQAGVLR